MFWTGKNHVFKWEFMKAVRMIIIHLIIWKYFLRHFEIRTSITVSRFEFLFDICILRYFSWGSHLVENILLPFITENQVFFVLYMNLCGVPGSMPESCIYCYKSKYFVLYYISISPPSSALYNIILTFLSLL